MSQRFKCQSQRFQTFQANLPRILKKKTHVLNIFMHEVPISIIMLKMRILCQISSTVKVIESYLLIAIWRKYDFRSKVKITIYIVSTVLPSVCQPL